MTVWFVFRVTHVGTYTGEGVIESLYPDGTFNVKLNDGRSDTVSFVQSLPAFLLEN